MRSSIADRIVVTPEQLVEHFCDVRDVGSLAEPSETGGARTCHGYCGFNGKKGSDSLIVGFDDGYEFMDYLMARGWKAMPDKGEWPYLIYLSFAPADQHAVVEFCEGGELAISQFESEERFEEFCRGLSSS